MWQIPRSLITVLLCATLGACSAANAHRMDTPGVAGCQSGADGMRRLELLFGLTLKDGSRIATAEWQSFVDAEVTPRFPEGLTVLRGYGQWRTKNGVIVRVITHVLVVWYRPDAESDAKIEAIRSAYKAQFTQESVMRVDSASCVSF